MRVAVDAGFLQTNNSISFFIKELFLRLARQHTGEEFIFFIDRPIDNTVNLPSNVTPILLKPVRTNFLTYKWWYDVKVPLAIKKYKADVFIGTDGLCSLTTAVPQVLIVRNL